MYIIILLPSLLCLFSIFKYDRYNFSLFGETTWTGKIGDEKRAHAWHHNEERIAAALQKKRFNVHYISNLHNWSKGPWS